MLKHSKDESLGERETYRQNRRHRLCSLCRVPRKTTPGVGGVLISVTSWGQFEVDLVRGYHWLEHRGRFSQLLMT